MTDGKWGILFVIVGVLVAIVGNIISVPIMSNAMIIIGVAAAAFGGYKLRDHAG